MIRQLYDATTHPTADLLPQCRRLEVIGDTTLMGRQPSLDGKLIPSIWTAGKGSMLDRKILKTFLSVVPTRTPISLNTEHTENYKVHRYVYAGGRVSTVSVSKYIALALAFAEAAHDAGLQVVSPFEAFHESSDLVVESARLLDMGFTDRTEHGQLELVRMNNDWLQDVFDASNAILVRNYFMNPLTPPLSIRDVTRWNIREGLRLARRGQRVIVITRPEGMNDQQLSAMNQAIDEFDVDVAYWAEMDPTHANQVNARKAVALAAQAEVRVGSVE